MVSFSPVMLDTCPLLMVSTAGYSVVSSLTILSGHYVENTGNTTLRFLEIFKSGTLFTLLHAFRTSLTISADKFEDVSLNQWLALTPPELVKDHLQFDDAVFAKLNTTKAIVV